MNTFSNISVEKYEVTVVTGDLWNAGTDANVYITLYGDRGDTGVRQLLISHNDDKFMNGQVMFFTVYSFPCSSICMIG